MKKRTFYNNDEFFKWLNKNKHLVNIKFVQTYKDKIIVKYDIITKS